MEVISIDGIRRFKRNGEEFISTYDVGIVNPRNTLETYFVAWVNTGKGPYKGYNLGFASAKEIAEVFPETLRQKKAKSKEQASEPAPYEELADANAFLEREVKRLYERVFELEAMLKKEKEGR